MAKTTARAMPGFIPPMLATLGDGPFDDPDCLFEVKWDGFRIDAVVDRDTVGLWTRGQQDAAARYFGPFLDPPTWIGAYQSIVDGEVIALDERVDPFFALIQARIKAIGVAVDATQFVYEVFYLLYLDGRSLREHTLMSNWIYARAGNPFRKPWLDTFFRAQAW